MSDPNNAAYERQLKVLRLRVRYWKAKYHSRSDASPEFAAEHLAKASRILSQLADIDEEP